MSEIERIALTTRFTRAEAEQAERWAATVATVGQVVTTLQALTEMAAAAGISLNRAVSAIESVMHRENG